MKWLKQKLCKHEYSMFARAADTNCIIEVKLCGKCRRPDVHVKKWTDSYLVRTSHW